ncbi:NAD(P)H-dependent oxidoreductase [Tenacibaculum ovolyticum]|uniref:NAD(P)H-dependent oxidoreductase n=1 Tax=Tenacibaculum ovolyticum TaxID=104270 RepID=UPI001F1C1BB3|nr:NAD(P)H-dependent oxidoreductase [Tenacibaculum ovolyticum]
MKNILVINAHQTWDGMSEGKLNEMYVELITSHFESQNFKVRTTTIYKGYDINEEVNKHVWADIVITQTPVFWFNTPWIHKKYVDEVFTAAWAQQKLLINDGREINIPDKQYGTGGISQGKKFMLSATWNAPKGAFNNVSQRLLEGKSADDALINITTNYKFCGFEIISGFHSYDVVKNPQIENDISRLKAKIDAIINSVNHSEPVFVK